jgi:chaperone required for assembly of F1-ATPase
VRLEVTTGLLPASQPTAATERLGQEVEALDDWQLVGLHALVTALGSIVLGLALRAGRLDPAAALEAALLDERFQVERWGEEAEQRRRHARLEADVAAAARFLDALREAPPREA